MYACRYVCMDGWIDGKLDGWMDGWTSVYVYSKCIIDLCWQMCLHVRVFVCNLRLYIGIFCEERHNYPPTQTGESS